MANTKNTAAGMDNISYKTIKNLPENILDIVLKLYNKFFCKGIVPSEWLNCRIKPILKSDGNSLRPIALLVCFRKLFEKLIYFRLEWWIENKKILNNQINGFRRGKGVAECLNELCWRNWYCKKKSDDLHLSRYCSCI